MSGTTIPYADRPLAYSQDGTGVFASPEFQQFLERLGSAAGLTSGTAQQNQQNITNNANAITTINNQLGTIVPALTSAAAVAANALAVANAAHVQQPTQATRDSASSVTVPTNTVTEVVSIPSLGGNFVVFATVYLTGSAIVNKAQISAGPTSGTMETAPGAFWTLATATNPSTLGSDLTLGTVVQMLTFSTTSNLYLNVLIDTPGTINAYGSLIAWYVGG